MKITSELFEEDKDIWADMQTNTVEEASDNYIWEGMDEPIPVKEDEVIELGMNKDEIVIRKNTSINPTNSMIYDTLRTGQVTAATDIVLKKQAMDIENNQRAIAEERKKEGNRHRKFVMFIRFLVIGVLVMSLLGIYLNNTERINHILHNIFFQETVIEERIELPMEE